MEWLIQRYKRCILVRKHNRMELYFNILNVIPCFIISGSAAAIQGHFWENIYGMTAVKSTREHATNS